MGSVVLGFMLDAHPPVLFCSIEQLICQNKNTTAYIIPERNAVCAKIIIMIIIMTKNGDQPYSLWWVLAFESHTINSTQGSDIQGLVTNL